MEDLIWKEAFLELVDRITAVVASESSRPDESFDSMSVDELKAELINQLYLFDELIEIIEDEVPEMMSGVAFEEWKRNLYKNKE